MGKFIVFEGTDGSGKSTQIKLLAEKLLSEGEKVFLTAEPTSYQSGKSLREALSGAVKKDASELALMFAIDRVNHNINPVDGINKMLSEGYTVLCDRYYYSSLAYQGDEAGYEWVKNLNTRCKDIRKPDLCIFLDVSPKVSMERIDSTRAEKEIFESLEKLTAVREAFYSIFADIDDRIALINAEDDIPSVSEKIYSEFKKLSKSS